MGNPDLLNITGATPEQEAILREITAWPGVPDLARPIHVSLGPGYPNHGGATGLTMADSFIPDPNHVGNTFLHEYGHVWDRQFLSTDDRQAIIRLHNMPYGWYGGEYMVRPAERFAGTFAKVMMASEGYFVNTPFEEIAPPFVWAKGANPMPKILDFPAALELAGLTVRYLDGWDTPARRGYYYRETDGDPAGHMHHHTAGSSGSYNPNRDKANGYAGLGREGSTRLYQEDYGDENMFPVYTIANIYPAPISSGAGDKNVLEQIREGFEVDGRSGADTILGYYSDGRPKYWYGNTHYWNTEWVLDGIGTHIDKQVWDMMVVVCKVQNDGMDWTRANHIGHGHHTRRKIDLYGGQFTDFDDTINHLRDAMGSISPPYNGEDIMPTEQWHQMIDALFLGRPDEFKGTPDYWKQMSTDSSEWTDFWAAFVRVIS